MTYLTKIRNSKFEIRNSREAGVTLLLSILVLSAIMAISFSLATILLVEVRVSGDLLKTEPAIYAANAVTEEALFAVSRGYSRCTNSNCSGQFTYTKNLGAVSMLNPPPTESLFNDPILQDTVLPSSNSITNTKNRYALFDPTDINAPSGYTGLRVTYKDSGAGGKIHVYVCEFNAPENFSPDDPPLDCNTPHDSFGYMKYNDQGPTGQDQGLTQGEATALMSLDSDKQQELIIFGSDSSDTQHIQIEGFGTGSVPKGIPYYGETAVDINAQQGGVTRAIRVRIPNTPFSVNSALGNVSSMNLDGVGDYALVANQASLSLNNFTVEAWVYPTATSSRYQTVLVKSNSTGSAVRNYAFWLVPWSAARPLRLYAGMYAPCATGRSITTLNSLNLNQWNHIAMTYDGVQFIAYINGVQAGISSFSAVPCTSTNPIRIGGGYVNYDSLNGMIDEVRIWNIAKDLATINASRNLELTGNEAGLVGYWKFNENTGTSAANSVSGGNPANFQLDATWSTNVPF